MDESTATAAGSDVDETGVTGAAAIAAWSADAAGSAVFLFDNAEALDDSARELLRACLEHLGKRQNVIVCTRSYINTPFSRQLCPTDVVTIGARELQFDREEIAALFDGALDKGALDRVESLTEGWPIALAVCRRAFQLGRLNHVLGDPDDVELRRFEGYVATEVVAGLKESELDALCLLSLVEDIAPADLAIALSVAEHDVTRLVKTLPLVRYDGKHFSLHGLLAKYLLRHHRQRRRDAGIVASDALLEAGADVLASRLAFASGDTDRAASALDPGVLFVSSPPEEVVDFVHALDGPTLMRHPRLWNAATLYRLNSLSNAEWQAEALTVWNQLPANACADTILGVANNVSVMLLVLGEWEHLEAFRDEAGSRFARAGIADDPTVRALSTLWERWSAAARMQPIELDRFLSAIAPLLGTEYVHAAVLRDIVARVHRTNGNRDGERSALCEAVRCAERASVPATLILCLQQAAISAWRAGEDTLFEHVVAQIARLQTNPAATDAGSHFLACVRGEALSAAPHGTPPPAMRAMSLLIGAERAGELTVRRAIIQKAISIADRCRYVEPMIVSRLVAATADERQAYRIDEARAIVDGLSGNTIFHRHFASVDATSSPLAPILARFRPRPAPRQAVIVELLSGTVRLAGDDAALSAREFGLLAFLALQPRPVNVDVVADTLWPNARGADGIASIRVYVNRIRKRLCDPHAIVSSTRAYRVGDHVTTDIEEIERRIAALCRETPPNDLAPVLELRRALANGPPVWVVDLHGLVNVQARVNAMLDDLDDVLTSWRDRGAANVRRDIDAALEDDYAVVTVPA